MRLKRVEIEARKWVPVRNSYSLFFSLSLSFEMNREMERKKKNENI